MGLAADLLPTVLDSSHIGFAVWDHRLRYQAINETLASMHGVPLDAHLGKTLRDILGPVAAQIEPQLEHVLATGENTYSELSAKLPNKTETGHWTARYFPVKDTSGRVRQVGAAIIDLTERKKLELSLFGLSRKLLFVDAALGTSMHELCRLIPGPTQMTERFSQLANVVKRCVSEMVALSELPNSPLRRITPKILSEYKVRLSSNDSESLRNRNNSPASGLSKRQSEIFYLLVTGKVNKEVADTLGISVRTVEVHRARLMLKLGIHSMRELVFYAVRNNIVEP
jgi:PAS domain S-box-containing protein